MGQGVEVTVGCKLYAFLFMKKTFIRFRAKDSEIIFLSKFLCSGTKLNLISKLLSFIFANV